MDYRAGLLAFLFAALLLAGCTQPQTTGAVLNSSAVSTMVPTIGVGSMAVKSGDTVKVDYLGTTEGKVFDTSIEAEAKKAGLPARPTYEPLAFTAGAGQVVPGFDKAVIGMTVGQEKMAVLKPSEAYGVSDPQAIVQVPRSMFDNSSEPQVGLQVQSPQGYPGVITKVDSQNVTVDFNHPLAGKELTFKIILREIVTK
ncbi:peptidylprolyl isomerase [Candidatus Micrarchaeota archaeon]|nr:peptidylprolyl isomerase [Candidatus Micrarchaeota archaeon]